jgi:adenosylcobinamide-GDP ribazoletransferase
MVTPVRDVALALSFLTRVPTVVAHDRPAMAFWAFPLVGAAIGLAVGAVHAGLTSGLAADRWLAALLAVAFQVWLTRGLHEDGLADTADAMGARGDAAAALAAMRDSRIGAFGVLALGLATALKVAALAALPPSSALAMLAAAGAVSRAGFALSLNRIAAARPQGLAAAMGRPSIAVVMVALASAVAIVWVSGAGVPAALAAALLGVHVTSAAGRRVGGLTGDVLGAQQQVVEVTFLVTAALWLSRA